MRAMFLTLLLVVVSATPLEAQVCREGPLPPLADLFPDEVTELVREFYDARDGCLTNLYRPANYRDPDAVTGPWAVVMIEPHTDPFLGISAEQMTTHYERSGAVIHEVDEWPITYNETGVGHEYVTLKGELRIAIMIKDAESAASSWALAEKFFSAILPKVLIRCQT